MMSQVYSACYRYIKFLYRSKMKRELNRKLRRISRYCALPRCSILILLFTGWIIYVFSGSFTFPLDTAPSPTNASLLAPPTNISQNSTCWPAYTCFLPKEMYTREDSFDKVLSAKASSEGIIYISLVDMVVVDLARNLIESSYRKHGINNFLFVCTDAGSAVVLMDNSVECYDMRQAWNDQRFYWSTMEIFKRKTHLKTKVALAALALGYTIIMTDVDMVFLKDPYMHLRKHLTACDIQFMQDTGDITTAFYIARPTSGTIKAHTMALEWGMAKRDFITDRQVMTRAVFNQTLAHNLKFRYLDSDLFLDGRSYFELGMRMFYSDNPCQKCVAVHNNWLFKHQAKIYRMKENLMWYLDDDGYFSNPFAKYITYANPITNIGDSVQTVTLEFEALRDALTIAFLLNRILILPAFHCGHCANDACQNINRHCALNAYINLFDFHNSFRKLYREHVFLANPRVPDAVRMSASRPIHIFSEKIQFELDYSMVKHRFVPKDPGLGADPEEIKAWFNAKPFSAYSVLNFHSLYGAFAGLRYKEEYRSNLEYRRFFQRLHMGLKEVDYRQTRPFHNDIIPKQPAGDKTVIKVDKATPKHDVETDYSSSKEIRI